MLVFRFCMILVAQRSYFGSRFGFTLRALGLWENSWKCCKGCQFQRFGPCPTESFYRPWLWVCFGNLFLQFFMIFSCLGTPILRAFGFNRCQKGGQKKKTETNSKKRSAVHAGKTDSRAVGPLKNKKTRHQDIRKPGNRRGGSNTPWRT